MTIQRHIAVLTGKRGGYGAMKPMLRALDEDPEFRLSLIVTDQHVNQAFGATREEVERDFEVAAAVDMEQANASGVARSRALGTCLLKMSGVLADLSPDLLVLYGDRGEVLVTALAALNLGIPIAHLQGGDVSGNIDDSMRHALTKLAHLHFPSTEKSAARIRAMGEEAWRITVVGDNHIDAIIAGDYTPPEVLRKRYDIAEGKRPIIVLFHPETALKRDGYADMRRILDVTLARGRRTIVVYPCSDQHYEDIVRAIDEVRGRRGVSVHTNIDAPDFLGLMSISAVMVGNSSAGLIETPYFSIAAINIGDRQNGRRHAQNVIHCGYGADELEAALGKALDDPEFATVVADCDKPFGDGPAYQKIFDFLKSVEIGPRLFNKRTVL